MNQVKQSDEWLMGQVASGARECLAILVRRYASPLLTYIERMVGDHHRSEELFQEVFLRVWLKRKTYRSPKAFRPWLFTIATNHCRSAFRRAAPPAAALPEEVPLALVSAEPSPAEATLATETAQVVTAAVAELPPQQRSVVVLRNFNGLSFAEIADVLGCTEATARSHLHYALGSLRRYLERRMGD